MKAHKILANYEPLFSVYLKTLNTLFDEIFTSWLHDTVTKNSLSTDGHVPAYTHTI